MLHVVAEVSHSVQGGMTQSESRGTSYSHSGHKGNPQRLRLEEASDTASQPTSLACSRRLSGSSGSEAPPSAAASSAGRSASAAARSLASSSPICRAADAAKQEREPQVSLKSLLCICRSIQRRPQRQRRCPQLDVQ